MCASNNKPKKPKITKLANTNMDKVIRKNKEMEALKNFDLSLLLEDPVSNEKPIYLFETDRIIEEELKGVNYGY